MNQDRIRVAVVGLGFGAEFVPIYLDHPDVESVAICDSDPARLRKVADRFAIRRQFDDVNTLVRSGDIDAVHLVSGIPDHARQAIAVLKSGKHCACTVPTRGAGPVRRGDAFFVPVCPTLYGELRRVWRECVLRMANGE